MDFTRWIFKEDSCILQLVLRKFKQKSWEAWGFVQVWYVCEWRQECRSVLAAARFVGA